MPAIGAVLNGAVSEGKTINLYYNTPTAQVALALKSGNSHPDDNYEYWAADASDFKGHVLNPSEVAAVQFRGVATVVAATVPNVPEGETPTVNNISLVSPVYQMLTTTSLANCKVAMASSGEKAWVYFLSYALAPHHAPGVRRAVELTRTDAAARPRAASPSESTTW